MINKDMRRVETGEICENVQRSNHLFTLHIIEPKIHKIIPHQNMGEPNYCCSKLNEKLNYRPIY